MSESAADRMVWLDALRITAGLSMVGLHATSDAQGLPFPDATAWERAGPVVLRTLLYMARTELFILISIFLLLLALERRPRSYRSVVAQQTERLVLPFLFWVAFYALYNVLKATHFGYLDGYLSQLLTLSNWSGYVLLGSIKYHMHFLPTLFPILLFYPVFKVAVRRPVLGLGILACLFIKRELDVVLWKDFQDLAGFEFYLRMLKVACYLGYGLAAGALWGLYKRGKAPLLFWPSVVLLGVALLVKLEHARLIATTGTWQWNYDPAYWADFLTPVGLFAFAMSAPHSIWPNVLVRMAPLSFGLYLMHPIFLDLAEIFASLWQLSPIEQIALKIVPTLVLTYGALLLVSRSSLLAWTIGLGRTPFSWRQRPQMVKP